jgi:hypothetical protein
MSYDGCFRCRGTGHPQIEADVEQIESDLNTKSPAGHTHADGTQIQKVNVRKGGIAVGTRPTLNFIQGTGITLTVADDPANNRINITIKTSGA